MNISNPPDFVPVKNTSGTNGAKRRSSTYGSIPGLSEKCSTETTLAIYRNYCFARSFDTCARRAQEEKRVKCFLYLSLGQETVASAVSVAMKGSYVLFQHRGHAFYLAFGGDPRKLIDELLGLPTGCCHGMGGSPPIHDIEKKILGHNGLIGDQVGVAVGVALAKPDHRVTCIFGDGAAEEDYVLSSLGYAATKNLKILFVCEDNDLSVLTPTVDRRSWNVETVAHALGMPAVDITDDPWLIEHHVRNLSGTLPALINIRTCRDVWHVGTGTDGPPEWNRHELMHAELGRLRLSDQAQSIALETQIYIEGLWNERLQRQSEILRKNT